MSDRDIHSAPVPEKRGLSRIEAADYVGVSSTLFDTMVADGRMPKPRSINRRKVWDRREVDAAFSDLPHVDGDVEPSGADEWDDVAA